MSGRANNPSVMQRRLAGLDNIDDFPTQPWGTRAFIERGPVDFANGLTGLTVWEPCAGRRTMSSILREYSPARLIETDIQDYGAGVDVMDFRHAEMSDGVDWIITNPPFALSLDLWRQAMSVARVGVAFLLRLSWLEGVERYHALHETGQVRHVAPYAERLPLVAGHLDQTASTATSYCWFVAEKVDPRRRPEVHVIPPCRKSLERAGDYDGWPNQYRLEIDAVTKAKRVVSLTDGEGKPIAGAPALATSPPQMDLLAGGAS